MALRTYTALLSSGLVAARVLSLWSRATLLYIAGGATLIFWRHRPLLRSSLVTARILSLWSYIAFWRFSLITLNVSRIVVAARIVDARRLLITSLYFLIARSLICFFGSDFLSARSVVAYWRAIIVARIVVTRLLYSVTCTAAYVASVITSYSSVHSRFSRIFYTGYISRCYASAGGAHCRCVHADVVTIDRISASGVVVAYIVSSYISTSDAAYICCSGACEESVVVVIIIVVDDGSLVEEGVVDVCSSVSTIISAIKVSARDEVPIVVVACIIITKVEIDAHRRAHWCPTIIRIMLTPYYPRWCPHASRNPKPSVEIIEYPTTIVEGNRTPGVT